MADFQLSCLRIGWRLQRAATAAVTVAAARTETQAVSTGIGEAWIAREVEVRSGLPSLPGRRIEGVDQEDLVLQRTAAEIQTGEELEAHGHQHKRVELGMTAGEAGWVRVLVLVLGLSSWTCWLRLRESR